MPHTGDTWTTYISHPFPLLNAPVRLKILSKMGWINLSLAFKQLGRGHWLPFGAFIIHFWQLISITGLEQAIKNRSISS